MSLLLPLLAAAATPALPARRAAVEAAVAEGMRRTGAKGVAVALIVDGRPMWRRAFGVRDAKGDALTATTIMYGASLTKAVFAYTVMRLVDEGTLDLDAPIAALLPKPLPDYGNLDAYDDWGDLAGDARWRRITPRMALTHATGFANFSFVEPDGKLRIHFEPGARYAYSGAGLILLQFALEQKLGHSFEDEARRLTFDPLGMNDTSLHWQPRWAARLADGFQQDGKSVAHDERSHVRVAGSMDTTLNDMAKFAAALVAGTNLSAASHAALLRPTLPITTASQFPTLQPELPPRERRRDLAAGLGVVTFSGPQGAGFYKGGHDDQTGNTMVCVRRGRRCVLILANDVRAEAMFPAIVRAALGETGVPWRWEYPEQFR